MELTWVCPSCHTEDEFVKIGDKFQCMTCNKTFIHDKEVVQ